jgi:hypothetical protein
MKDFLYLSHRFKGEDIPFIEKTLKDNNLTSIVDFERDGFLAGMFSTRLPISDVRLEFLKSLIEKDSSKPFIRFDREFSTKELNNYDFLVVSLATSRLENPPDNQKYDFANACTNCGSGVQPIEPLTIPQNSMGKKLIDITAHNGWLIFRKELAKRIEKEKLSGISFHSVKIGRNENDYLWGKVENVLPRLNSLSQLRFNHSNCETCKRSGNYENFETETRYFYDNTAFDCFLDFNLTNEFFGEWKFSKLGGSQHLIISQKVRQLFIEEKVRFLKYKPIEK